MALVFLDRSPHFPPVSQAEPDGLLAIGGDLSPQRLLSAYRQGIFPWYEDEPILWWSPDPRFVLFPAELKISRSMRPVLNGNRFRFTMNQAFTQVMKNCRQVKRNGQRGSWINEEMIRSYTELHEMGFAFSAEAWEGDQLAGGLYGLRIGKVFCGERRG